MLGMVSIVVILFLLTYSVAMTYRAIRARRHCTCGAQAGSFTPLTDVSLRIFETPTRTHASRWGDDTFARLQSPPEILREDEI